MDDLVQAVALPVPENNAIVLGIYPTNLRCAVEETIFKIDFATNGRIMQVRFEVRLSAQDTSVEVVQQLVTAAIRPDFKNGSAAVGVGADGRTSIFRNPIKESVRRKDDVRRTEEVSAKVSAKIFKAEAVVGYKITAIRAHAVQAAAAQAARAIKPEALPHRHLRRTVGRLAVIIHDRKGDGVDADVLAGERRRADGQSERAAGGVAAEVHILRADAGLPVLIQLHEDILAMGLQRASYHTGRRHAGRGIAGAVCSNEQHAGGIAGGQRGAVHPGGILYEAGGERAVVVVGGSIGGGSAARAVVQGPVAGQAGLCTGKPIEACALYFQGGAGRIPDAQFVGPAHPGSLAVGGRAEAAAQLEGIGYE